MIVKPRMREFICTTAHPTGCGELVRRQAARMAGAALPHVPRRVLVIGCSGGYGLATRVAAAFGGGAATIGVSLERPPAPDRTASAGWYSNRAFDALAAAAGHDALTVEGDAFSDAVKAETCDAIRARFGQLDLLTYSLAAPVRRDPLTGEIHRAAVKPLAALRAVESLDTDTGRVVTIDVAAATDAERRGTVKVMGGEDWRLWIERLAAEGLLSPAFRTHHYTYVGSEMTRPIYGDGTIGLAKADAEAAAGAIDARLGPGRARIVALPAVVTQASSAIPILPLYASILRAVLRDRGGAPDPLAAVRRLFAAAPADLPTDAAGRIRLDGAELDPAVQAEIAARRPRLAAELAQVADFPGYRAEQLALFGFGVPGVDYARPVDPMAVSFAPAA